MPSTPSIMTLNAADCEMANSCSDSGDFLSRRELVVLVHGFAANRLLMSYLERRLRRSGYATFNWGYGSFLGSLEKHARRLQDALKNAADKADILHLVAHSMGTSVARLALSHERLPTVGRLVLLAPPNRGCPAARVVGPLCRRLCPALSQLSDRPDSLINQMAPPQDVSCGVISARFDWLVPQASTHLSGQADHICISGTHSSLLFQPETARQIGSFLSTGMFSRR